MRRFVTSVAAAIAFVAVAAWLFGPRGAAAGAALAFLGVVWRHDNQSGACLPLAVLMLIVLGVMAFLMVMLVIVAPR
jgi:hypothetical protein